MRRRTQVLGSLLAIVAGLFSLLGNIYAKEWATRQRVALFALTLTFYIASSVVFPFSLKFGTLTVLNTVASIVTVVLTPLIGLALFRERVNLVQAVGLVIGVFAILLLTLPFRAER